MRHGFAGVMVTVALALAGMQAAGDELAAKGRDIFEKHKDSVVTIKLVVKQQFSMPGFGSQEQESKDEIIGTVIDPSGLTVVALSSADPTAMFQSMMEMSGEDTQGLQMNSQVTDLRILMPDDTEVPGQIVLRDKDLDLAFIRPKEALKQPMTAVDLKDAAKPAVLDPVFTIARLGRVAGREHACSIERINAIVTKPRTLFVPGNDPTQTDLGSPAFTVDGQVVGVLVMRTVKSIGGGSSMMHGNAGNTMAVIVPAEDIAEVAAQAPAKVEESQQEATEQPEKKDSATPGEGAPPAEKPAEGNDAKTPKEGA